VAEQVDTAKETIDYWKQGKTMRGLNAPSLANINLASKTITSNLSKARLQNPEAKQ